MATILRVTLPYMVVLAVACGGDDRPLPEDVGQVCTDFGDVACDRAGECGLLTGTVQACVNDFYALCCANDGECNNPVAADVSEAEYNDCLDDYGTLACNDVEQGNLPSSCLRL